MQDLCSSADRSAAAYAVGFGFKRSAAVFSAAGLYVGATPRAESGQRAENKERTFGRHGDLRI